MNKTGSSLTVNRETLRQILDFLPYPLLVSQKVKDEIIHIFFNQQFKAEFGYTLEEIPTMNDWFVIAYPDAAYRQAIQSFWTDLLKQAEDQGSNFVMAKAKITTKSGSVKWFEVKTSLFFKGFQLVSFVNIDDLITKDEQLERANENKNRMLSILSHDLRSAMINLQSLTSLAVDHSLSLDEFISLAARVRGKSAQAIELLDTTVQWTKSNFENIQPIPQSVDIKSTIEGILSLDNSHREKRIEISQQLDFSHTVFIDQGIITIVIRNLISNAIKFTPVNGKILLKSWTDEEGHHLMIKDSGMGMNQETIDAVLSDRYSPSVGTLREKGSGVGLTLCRELLKKINCTLSINSYRAIGTEVSILMSSVNNL